MMFPTVVFDRAPFANLHRQFGRLIDEIGDFAGGPVRPFPAMNVWEDGETFRVEAELPGMKLEDLEIVVVGPELTLKGRMTGTSAEGRVIHRHERRSGEFSRTLTLPTDVNAEGVEATLRDGVLNISLPKTAASRARRIPVRAAN